MKKTISVILSLIIIFSLTSSIYSEDMVEPLWDNTMSVHATIDFLGTKGTFTASIVGYNYATDIHLMAWLYYKDANGNWIEQTTWGALSTTNTLGMDRTFTGISGPPLKVNAIYTSQFLS